MVSLNPDNVLARGYARVLGAAGQTVTSAQTGAREARLTIKFSDGTLGVVPEGAAKQRATAPPVVKPPRRADNADQPKLL